MIAAAELGIDYGSLWDSVKQAGTQLVTKDLPAAAEKAIVRQAQAVAAPVVQQVAVQKASEAAVKGKAVMLASIGGGVGLLLGVVVAGGSWKRRAVGGAVTGAVLASAGALAGLKIGLLTD